jgi:hypothetical protein
MCDYNQALGETVLSVLIRLRYHFKKNTKKHPAGKTSRGVFDFKEQCQTYLSSAKYLMVLTIWLV